MVGINSLVRRSSDQTSASGKGGCLLLPQTDPSTTTSFPCSAPHCSDFNAFFLYRKGRMSRSWTVLVVVVVVSVILVRNSRTDFAADESLSPSILKARSTTMLIPHHGSRTRPQMQSATSTVDLLPSVSKQGAAPVHGSLTASVNMSTEVRKRVNACAKRLTGSDAPRKLPKAILAKVRPSLSLGCSIERLNR